MGKQMTMFDVNKKPKKRLTAVERKQKKELQALFNSGQEMNQRLAWGLCEQMGLTKKKMLSDFWLNEFDNQYLDIEARMGDDYAEGLQVSAGEVDVMTFEVLGIEFELTDNSEECLATFNERGGKKICVAIAYWGHNDGIEAFLDNVRHWFYQYLIENMQLFESNK